MPDGKQTEGTAQPAAFGDVVITEVMANPKYAAGLPEAEYIEIMNRTRHTLSTKGWVMTYGTAIYDIPESDIAPEQYVILTHEKHAMAWDSCGVASRIDMPRFPAIANESERYFAISDSCNTLLAWDLFCPDYITDEFKRKGGFSVELTDTDRTESSYGSHAASCDRRGGTPGEPNSVQKESDEVFIPSLTSASHAGDGKIRLTFSAPACRERLADRHSYTIDGAVPGHISMEADSILCTEAEIYLPDMTDQAEITLHALTTPGGTPFAVPENISIAEGHEAEQGSLAITEIMFKADDTVPEYIELYNTSDVHISLDGLWVAAAGTDRTYKTPAQVAEAPLQIAPQSYLCLTAKPDMVAAKYGTPLWNIVETSLPSLSNDGGYVRITDSSGMTIDEAIFSDDSYPTAMKEENGISLERINTALDPMSPQSWLPATKASGYGTPAAPNSQQYEGGADNGSSFTASTDVISPDGDGTHDFLAIDYSLPGTGYTADVTVFDSRGTAIRHIARREMLPQQGTLVWDGQDDSGSTARRGIYIVVIKADGPDGNVEGDKIAVAVN